ncbi:L-alanine-DL-glutamate epimerase-like enolase superfamily enzyme [Azospirillum agricola]|uniref:mandelate racemase/muconate lactonizing enzyme family protein n=1 Tax=Azospirillum agricola TaxID=1720247 RepID=UPI001AE65725|nr:mandelate racemase/muconate lactonizing enzyme family protein [Azospirillum agricola]MBP2231852.1 L-alanine-DL-glutamate epimerase-like enolase superfamily enzyme [Azospirillum agricola]
MKITKVETILLAVPCSSNGAIRPSTGRSWSAFDVLLVRIDTDAGISGWGEAFGRARDLPLKAVIDAHIAPKLIGQDPTRIEAIKHDLEFRLHNTGRIGGIAYGIAAVDIALWDILGKRAGLPLHQLIGGLVTPELPVYASFLRYGSVEGVRGAVRKALAEGYRHIKLHEIGIAENLAAREEAGPDVAIMLDVNCPWTVSQSIDAARRLAPGNFDWLEEPVWPPENYGGLGEIRRKGSLRIAAGENAGSLHDFKAMFDAGAIDVAQPDLAKAGGISEALRIDALAEAHGVDVVPHCATFGPGLLATIHFNASRRRPPLLERLYFAFDEHPIGAVAEPVDGFVKVPTGPGLGYDPDPRVIERYRVEPAEFAWT